MMLSCERMTSSFATTVCSRLAMICLCRSMMLWSAFIVLSPSCHFSCTQHSPCRPHTPFGLNRIRIIIGSQPCSGSFDFILPDDRNLVLPACGIERHHRCMGQWVTIGGICEVIEDRRNRWIIKHIRHIGESRHNLIGLITYVHRVAGP